jgi:hypothetical protein
VETFFAPLLLPTKYFISQPLGRKIQSHSGKMDWLVLKRHYILNLDHRKSSKTLVDLTLWLAEQRSAEN